MTVSQNINHIMDDKYDIDITITDVPNKYFLAVTKNQLPAGSSTREITIEIMFLEQNPGGTQTANSGLFTKGSNENSVKVTVQQNGNVKAENTTNY